MKDSHLRGSPCKRLSQERLLHRLLHDGTLGAVAVAAWEWGGAAPVREVEVGHKKATQGPRVDLSRVKFTWRG